MKSDGRRKPQEKWKYILWLNLIRRSIQWNLVVRGKSNTSDLQEHHVLLRAWPHQLRFGWVSCGAIPQLLGNTSWAGLGLPIRGHRAEFHQARSDWGRILAELAALEWFLAHCAHRDTSCRILSGQPKSHRESIFTSANKYVRTNTITKYENGTV